LHVVLDAHQISFTVEYIFLPVAFHVLNYALVSCFLNYAVVSCSVLTTFMSFVLSHLCIWLTPNSQLLWLYPHHLLIQVEFTAKLLTLLCFELTAVGLNTEGENFSG
jgi:hypothetical protein